MDDTFFGWYNCLRCDLYVWFMVLVDLNWLNWMFMILVRILVYDLDEISWFRCFYDDFFYWYWETCMI